MSKKPMSRLVIWWHITLFVVAVALLATVGGWFAWIVASVYWIALCTCAWAALNYDRYVALMARSGTAGEGT